MKRYLKKEELSALSEEIRKAESETSGEIRLVLRHKRRLREKKLSLHDLTFGEFLRLKMQNTRDRTGIIILVLFKERRFHIYADEGIHSRVADGTWDRIAALMTEHFKAGNFTRGLTETIRKVGAELARHFPRRPDDKNELPDEVIEE